MSGASYSEANGKVGGRGEDKEERRPVRSRTHGQRRPSQGVHRWIPPRW